MKKFILAFAIVISAFTMSACVHIDYGPSDNTADAEYVQSVKAVLDSNEAIKFMNKAYLLANTAKPGPAQTWGVFGTVVSTDKTLYFLFWDRNAKTFNVLRKLPVADMDDINHISSIWGPGDYIAIKDKSRRIDLYSCYTIPATADVVEKNRELLNSLNAARNAQ